MPTESTSSPHSEDEPSRGLVIVIGPGGPIPPPPPSNSRPRIVRGSEKLVLTPGVPGPHIEITPFTADFLPARRGAQGKGQRVLFADAELTFTGDPGDSLNGWTVGFLQAQWIETNWAHYRGRTVADGSLFLQRGAAVRPQSCQDSAAPGDIWYGGVPGGQVRPSGGVFPTIVSPFWFDGPADQYNLVEMNGLTQQPNFLHEAQLEFHFCTVLSAQDPSGQFHHLRYFYWNIHWQATFYPDHQNFGGGWRFQPDRRPLANGLHVSKVSHGAPHDKRFDSVLTASGLAKTCNQFAAGPAFKHEHADWSNFNVTR